MELIKSKNFKNLLRATTLSGFFYVFMEWLFFATKPSSLSILTTTEKAGVFFVTGGVVVILLLILLLLFSTPAFFVTGGKSNGLQNIPRAFILSLSILLLFDNFTYTLFEFGVVTTLGNFRALYTIGFLIVFLFLMRSTSRAVEKENVFASRLALVLLTVSLGCIAYTYASSSPYTVHTEINSSREYPNIIIMGSDGLSDNFMSAFGFEQDTTPFISELVKTSLVAENAFPNASSTTASTTSILTGKDPVTVNVLRYPDILSGNDSFEHLPAILKREGYQTVQIGVPYYVDALWLNMLDGFDIINTRSAALPALVMFRNVLGNSPSLYFLQTLTSRAEDRLLHIFFFREMENPIKAVKNNKARMNDDDRVDQIIDIMENADQPVFIFAHFMDTHGPDFFSEDRGEDEPSTSDGKWHDPLYKAALKSYDQNVSEVYHFLESSGHLDDTVFIIYTDHGYRYTVNQRVPIIIHFPNNDHAGVRKNNIDILDLPVTLLDYLDISKPDWMTGISFLDNEPPSDRLIFSTVGGSPRDVAPPFFQIKTLQLLQCDRWYAWNIQKNIMKPGNVPDHTLPCEPKVLLTEDEARLKMLEYLEKNGYDTRSLTQ